MGTGPCPIASEVLLLLRDKWNIAVGEWSWSQRWGAGLAAGGGSSRAGNSLPFLPSAACRCCWPIESVPVVALMVGGTNMGSAILTENTAHMGATRGAGQRAYRDCAIY